MKALVAIQRKLLEFSYIVHKNKTVFKEDYEQEKRAIKLKIMIAP